MQAILRREFSSYFRSPLGYIFLALFYFFGGQFFSTVFSMGYNLIAYVFNSMFTILMFIVPILTMKLMSEELRQKTDQALFTAPVSVHGIVWGKFLAAFSLFGIAVASTVVYFLVLSAFSSPQWSIFIGNLLGLLLMGAALISIGLFISSLTESQMVAAVATFSAIYFVFLIDSVSSLIPVAWLKTVLSQLSFMSRYSDFTSGILSIPNILFFVSVIVVFNFLTVRFLEKKRWS